VLLAVDGLDVGGEKLQHGKYKILMKWNGTVRLAEYCSIRVSRKCVFYVILYHILYSTLLNSS
jgi:hypothetical protein